MEEKISENTESKETYWSLHFRSWKESGLSQKNYCTVNNLKYNQFQYWYRKSKAEKSLENSVKKGQFLKIDQNIFRNDFSGSLIRIFSNNMCVELSENVNSSSLKKILEVIKYL